MNAGLDRGRRNCLVAGSALLAACGAGRTGAAWGAGALAHVPLPAPVVLAPDGAAAHFEVEHSDAQWRTLLTPAQYAVLREGGTERAFTSPLNEEHRRGKFTCAGCALALFASATKFDSGTGWPSFWRPLDRAVDTSEDRAFGWVRTAVHCHRCGGHLGHVFDDGPRPTGLRYCINGVALAFVADGEKS